MENQQKYEFAQMLINDAKNHGNFQSEVLTTVAFELVKNSIKPKPVVKEDYNEDGNFGDPATTTCSLTGL